MKLGTRKLLKENRQNNIFFDPSSRLMEIKINKWDLFKPKRICSARETIKKTSHILGEKFANDVTNKGLVSKIYK